METRVIARINNVDIVSTSDEQLVPIRPICEALGIDYSRQLKKIKDDPDLCSVVGDTPTTASDGKTYRMVCLPVRYIFGWLFTVNPNNVAPEAKEAVCQYRRACYDILYEHFMGGQQKQIEQNKMEIALLEDIAEIKELQNELKQQQSQLKQKESEKYKQLEKLRAERLSNEPTLF